MPAIIPPPAIARRLAVPSSLVLSLLIAFFATNSAAAADPAEYTPPTGTPYTVQGHYIWCGEAKSPGERVKRFEKFWARHRPAEADGYDDSVHIRIVRRCAYRLANLYAELGRKQDCIKMLKWLEKEDDTLDIGQD